MLCGPSKEPQRACGVTWGLWGSAPAEGTRWGLCLRAVVLGKACGGAAQGQEDLWSLVQGKCCGGGTSLGLWEVVSKPRAWLLLLVFSEFSSDAQPLLAVAVQQRCAGCPGAVPPALGRALSHRATGREMGALQTWVVS